MTITSTVLGSFAPRSCFPHEPGYIYLFSPVASWDGHVAIDGRLVHRGSVRPGMLRLSTGTALEDQKLPSQAKALVIRIPEFRLQRMFEDLSVKASAAEIAKTPINFVDSRVLKLVQVLMARKAVPQESRGVITEGITQALLGLLIAHHNQQREYVRQPQMLDRLTNEDMDLSRQLLDQQTDEPVTIRRWAAHLNMSPANFSRRFFKTNGMTPHAWLLERRVQQARQLLCTTDRPLCQIALSLGFASQSHLTETFRRIMGSSPARWRRAHREDSIAQGGTTRI